jgi:hypothetical protein
VTDSKGNKVLASDGWIRYNGSVRLIEMNTNQKNIGWNTWISIMFIAPMWLWIMYKIADYVLP